MTAAGSAPSRFTALRLERDGGLARVTLHRPAVRNAFDEVLIGELTGSLEELAADPAVRVVVLAGSGDAFCAGADLHWMQKMRQYTYQENLADSQALAELLYRLYALPKPTVARVHGAVIGGGNGLVAACDMAIASREAFFGLSEVRLGLVPACIGPYVVKKVGEGAARALFLTGERISAERAHEIGLVNEVTSLEELDHRVDAVVKLLLTGGPEAQRSCKELLEGLGKMSFAEARSHTAELIARMRVGDEAQEGMAAFFAKRRPKWAE